MDKWQADRCIIADKDNHVEFHPISAMAGPEPGDDFEDVRELIQFLKENAEELRSKGVPVDEMIRDLERQIEIVRAAREKERDAHARLKDFERERADRRREVDAIAARLPPDCRQTSRTGCPRRSTWRAMRRGRPSDGGAAGDAWASREQRYCPSS